MGVGVTATSSSFLRVMVGCTLICRMFFFFIYPRNRDSMRDDYYVPRWCNAKDVNNIMMLARESTMFDNPKYGIVVSC